MIFDNVNNVNKAKQILKSIINFKLIGVSAETKEEISHIFFADDDKFIFQDEKKSFNRQLDVETIAKGML